MTLQVAIHEAGHAVVALALDHVIGTVTIEPNFELSEAGSVVVSDPFQTWALWESRGKFRDFDVVLRARALIKMAGAEAEVEFFGSCQGGDGDDREEVHDALYRVGVAGPAVARMVDSDAIYARYEPRLRRWTRALVRRHRTKIDRIARALLERKTLSGEEIEALYLG
jgi:ATP-dependent Zn protease